MAEMIWVTVSWAATASSSTVESSARRCLPLSTPVAAPLVPNTDYHIWKQLLRDAGVRDGRLRDARHAAATVLLLLGVPDVVVDAIMGWAPGGAARMRARYMHITGPMLTKVAQQIGDALWRVPEAN
ncbi:hypothetical protein [Streptomyces sp. NBC_00390]|uniref:hypothetical protein n=1 Tax=Streptomyces sp. NBC_00390 TaxID=2975736 RepID=UPI003FCE5FAA